MIKEKQYAFLLMFSNLLNKGYTLTDTIHMLRLIEKKHTEKFDKGLKLGLSLHDTFKSLKYPPFVVNFLQIGEETNQLNSSLILILEQYQFYFTYQKLIKKLLTYPLSLFFLSLLGFEILRLKLLPTILRLIEEFNLTVNHLFLHLAFNSFKYLLFIFLILYLLSKMFPTLLNLFSLTKECRSLTLGNQLLMLLKTNTSLADSLQIIEKSNKQYKANLVTDFLLLHKQKKLQPFATGFLNAIALGVKSNNLVPLLSDYQSLLLERVNKRLKAILQGVSYALLLLIACNIFIIYLLIMLPMLQISGQF